jgi:hypothetical protein
MRALERHKIVLPDVLGELRQAPLKRAPRRDDVFEESVVEFAIRDVLGGRPFRAVLEGTGDTDSPDQQSKETKKDAKGDG